MCYQTGSRSSGRVRRWGGGLSVYFALVYCSINYPAVDAALNNATHHQAPVNHQKYTHPLIRHVALKGGHAADSIVMGDKYQLK